MGNYLGEHTLVQVSLVEVVRSWDIHIIQASDLAVLLSVRLPL